MFEQFLHHVVAAPVFIFDRVQWRQLVAEMIRREKDTLAAVVVEPVVQGASGMRMYPPALLRELAETADDPREHVLHRIALSARCGSARGAAGGRAARSGEARAAFGGHRAVSGHAAPVPARG